MTAFASHGALPNLLSSAQPNEPRHRSMVESSRLYPDIEAPVDPRYGVAYPTPNAPPMTAAQSERWPLTSAVPVYTQQREPYNAYYVPPSYGEPPAEYHRCHHHRHQADCNCENFLLPTLKLGLFHLLNALLGLFAFVAVTTGVHVAVGLIPLCCVGLLVFRGVVVLVRWLATLDAKLSNYVAPRGEAPILIADEPLGGFVGLRLSPELSYFSPVSLLGALYFSTVKFLLSIASFIVVAVLASLPLMLLAFSSDDNDTEWLIELHHHKKVDLREYPFAFYVIWGCLFILTIVAMHMVAWLSRAMTRFFCCERVYASEYNTIPIVQYPATATAATMYGSNIPIRRTDL